MILWYEVEALLQSVKVWFNDTRCCLWRLQPTRRERTRERCQYIHKISLAEKYANSVVNCKQCRRYILRLNGCGWHAGTKTTIRRIIGKNRFGLWVERCRSEWRQVENQITFHCADFNSPPYPAVLAVVSAACYGEPGSVVSHREWLCSPRVDGHTGLWWLGVQF